MKLGTALTILFLLFYSQLSAQVRVVLPDSTTQTLNDATIVSTLDGELHLEYMNSEGVWQDAGTLVVKHRGAWWQRSWFVVVIALLVGFLGYLVYRFYFNKTRKEALMEVRLAHLERSALQAQMNPHFIFNSLNSIQSYIANNENDKANRFLAKFAKLIRSMLNHSRAQKVSLQEEIDSLTLYMDLEKMRFKDKFNFEVMVDEDIDTYDIMIPPLLIQPYLENAIIHGLAQARSAGKINLYYLLDGKYLRATVTDNGIGIEQSKKLKKGDSLHKSVGMTITQKRLEMLDEGNSDKKVKIEEIKDRKGEVLGTKVEVKIRVA